MVGVGFIIGVVQDSVETALNSAGDVEFAAVSYTHLVLVPAVAKTFGKASGACLLSAIVVPVSCTHLDGSLRL